MSAANEKRDERTRLAALIWLRHFGFRRGFVRLHLFQLVGTRPGAAPIRESVLGLSLVAASLSDQQPLGAPCVRPAHIRLEGGPYAKSCLIRRSACDLLTQQGSKRLSRRRSLLHSIKLYMVNVQIRDSLYRRTTECLRPEAPPPNVFEGPGDNDRMIAHMRCPLSIASSKGIDTYLNPW